MRNYVELRKLAYEAIDEAGVNIDPPLLLAEMAGLKEDRQNHETYKATQMTDAECISEMVEVAKSCKDWGKMNKENLLDAMDWLITHGFNFWDNCTDKGQVIVTFEAFRILKDAYLNGQESSPNEEAVDEALKNYNKEV